MFQELCRSLEKYNYGVHGYEKLSREAFQQAKIDDQNALPLFVIAELALRFANRYDWDPLPLSTALEQKSKFNQYMESLDKAFQLGEKEQYLALTTIIYSELRR